MTWSYIWKCKRNYKLLNYSLRPFSSPSSSSSSSSSPSSSSSSLKSFQGPKRLPLVGNALELGGFSKILGYMDKCSSTYGDIFSIGIGKNNIIICGDANFAEYILSYNNNNNGKNYANRPPLSILDDVSHVMVPQFPNDTTGIVFANGERHWGLPRRAAGETLLTKSFLQNSLHKINRHVNEHIDIINNNNNIEYHANKQLSNLFMDIIGELAFSLDFKLKKGSELKIAHRVRNSFELVNYFFGQPFPYWRYFPSKKFNLFISHSREIDNFFTPYVNESVEKTKQQDSSKDSTFLDVLSRGYHEHGLTKPEIIGNALQILAAGSDTTENTVIFSVYLLGKYPQYQKLIYDEIKNIDLNNYDSTNNLTFTTAFIKEVLRLYPSAFIFTRQAIINDKWNDYKISSTDHIWIAPYLLGRNKKYWGENALDFNPNRFLENRRGNNNNPFAWIPFGFGARQCVGFRIALLEVKLFLAHFIKHFTWTLDPRSSGVKPTAKFTIKPDRDVILSLQKRN